MSILRLDGVRREIGTFIILDGVSGAVAHGERIGLVGANGAGKTTLLKIAIGREEPDAGRVIAKQGLRMGLLSQEANLDAAFAAASSVRAGVRAGAFEVERLEAELAALEAAGAEAVQAPEYATLQARFEALGGYFLDQRVDEALSGLGISREAWERSPLELSGGEQTRAALARLVVSEPDLLLLDEPTNHLDVAAIEWLEQALVRRSGALLVASHDRAFLDAVAGRIWELRDRRLEVFRGAYSAYLIQRESRDARQRLDADVQATAAAREQELIQRYRSHRKYTKMHEHERRLEQLQSARIDRPKAGARLALRTEALLGGGPTRSGDMVVSLRELVAGFPPIAADGGVDGAVDGAMDRAADGAVMPGGARGIPIVRVGRLEASRGERIGIVGPNGAGKTTLLRTIAGELMALEGTVRLGASVQAAYLAQIRGRAFAGSTVLDALLEAAHVDTGVARGYLARFLFRGEDVFKPVSEVSGGERSRLELALLGVTPANLLLLDEPTNHLDIPAREALEAFLRDSPATLLIVSHDRRLLEGLCDRLWVVEPGAEGAPGRTVAFEGGYRAWRSAVADGWSVAGELELQSRRLDGGGAGRTLAPGPAVRDQKSGRGPRAAPSSVPSPRRAAPMSKDAYRKQKSAVEDDLTRLGLRKSHLELALGDGAVQSNFVELRRLTSELADVEAALGQAEEAWLVLAERAPR